MAAWRQGIYGIYGKLWKSICHVVMTNMAIANGTFIVADLPIKDCDFPVRYVSLPEANRYFELEQLEIAKESKLVYFHG